MISTSHLTRKYHMDSSFRFSFSLGNEISKYCLQFNFTEWCINCSFYMWNRQETNFYNYRERKLNQNTWIIISFKSFQWASLSKLSEKVKMGRDPFKWFPVSFNSSIVCTGNKQMKKTHWLTISSQIYRKRN